MKRSSLTVLAIMASMLVFAAMATPVRAQSAKRAVAAPCKAATATVRYGRILKLPVKLKAEIGAYRRGWAAACAKGGGASLGALLARSERIKTGMIKAIGRRRAQGKTADRLHIQLGKVYPRFVPAMEGSIIEFEYFEPMIEVFKAHARLGNAEDRMFFRNHTRLFGGDFKAPPWIERTWDYGGCIRLGRWSPHGPAKPGYDFVKASRDIAILRTVLQNTWYRDRVQALEVRMLKTLTQLPQLRGSGKPAVIDGCGSKADTVRAMRRIEKAFQHGHSPYRRAAAGLRRTLAAIKTRQVRVCEKASCSGG